MYFPVSRMRRFRKSPEIRDLVRDVHLSTNDFIYPMFVIYGKNKKIPVPSMPGVFQLSLDNLAREVEEVVKKGIKAVLLFGIPEAKDAVGSGAYAIDGIVQQGVFEIKKHFPNLIVVTDVCLCEYTDHGHCGLVEKGDVLNDPTLDLLAQTALSHVQSGADIVAPSDMMDGRVDAIRSALDKAGHLDIPVMSYAVKYASAFYGPFREAADSTPQYGDRKTYQMDPASSEKQAIWEAVQDVQEGADYIIVKPAMAYMDIIKSVKEEVLCPVVSYNVSGEYAMIKGAAQNGWIDERSVVLELMTGLKRAGSDLIITYHALDIATWLKD